MVVRIFFAGPNYQQPLFVYRRHTGGDERDDRKQTTTTQLSTFILIHFDQQLSISNSTWQLPLLLLHHTSNQKISAFVADKTASYTSC